MIIRNDTSSTGSRSVEKSGTIYISGITALDRSVGMKYQTNQIFVRLNKFLEDAKSDKDKVLFANVFLVDMNLKAEMDEAWAAYFHKDHQPARATVGVADLGENCLIEMQFVAHT